MKQTRVLVVMPARWRASFHIILAVVMLLAGVRAPAAAGDLMESGFADPPPEARLHAYWWWLNGNVTREAITRDLEAMREKGFGGALIIDAGGANQDGNRQVPHGPDFASPAWRELFRHTLREAARLKLELALNIQSGWNLGGPGVTPADAAKILCWTETPVVGPGPVSIKLPPLAARAGLLGEVAVVAVPELHQETIPCTVTASSTSPGYPASRLRDGQAGTFWVSDGVASGKDGLAWIRLAFDRERPLSAFTLTGRPGHGPKALELIALDADGRRQPLAMGQPLKGQPWRAAWKVPLQARQLEIRIIDAYDTKPGKPRNVQVAEIALDGPGWHWPSRLETLDHWEEKTLLRPLGSSTPDTSLLLAPETAPSQAPGLKPSNVVDLSRMVDTSGTLTWTVPAGAWRVFRFCYTMAPRAHVSTSSEGWEGLALDPLDPQAFQRYWDAVVEPLLRDAHAVAGNTLKYLHTDSWEIEPYNWTPRLPEAFRARCGYEMLPWLPALAGRVVGGAEASNRFLHDFRKTVAALTAENHFRPFLENAHRHGLQVRAESGGPHAVPIDAQHCLGMIDAPMSEFWASSWRHRVTDESRFFVKQPAMAAHTYGKQIVAAEGFTTIGPHWQERVWCNLKPALDRALCEGLNQLVWTLVTCAPRETGMPGQEMFPGTHFNPNSTWWRQSEGFLAYINRCQWMLRQGHFVADALYYYGDHAPNFAQLKASNPAQLPPGYDYDVATEYVVLNRLAVKAGRMVLPDGMSYGALVLAPQRTVSLPVLRKLRALAEAGGVLIGARPESSSGLAAWQQGDGETRELIDVLWGKAGGKPGLVRYADSAAWLKSSALPPDFSVPPSPASAEPKLDFIHRRDGATEIYFVANPGESKVRFVGIFRAPGKVPELWDPRDGTIRSLPEWAETGDHRQQVPLDLEAYGSCFVVFRKSIAASFAGKPTPGAMKNIPVLKDVAPLPGTVGGGVRSRLVLSRSRQRRQIGL